MLLENLIDPFQKVPLCFKKLTWNFLKQLFIRFFTLMSEGNLSNYVGEDFNLNIDFYGYTREIKMVET